MKYTNEQLIKAVKDNFCMNEVLEKIGASKTSGSLHRFLSKRIKILGCDTSHFKNSSYFIKNRFELKAQDILVFDRRFGVRERTSNLNKALKEIGREYKCEVCGIGNQWNGYKLLLEIDHIDNNPINNIETNLRYICPNCHSQKGSAAKTVD